LRNREAKIFPIFLILLIAIGTLTTTNVTGDNQSETNDSALRHPSLTTSQNQSTQGQKDTDQENKSDSKIEYLRYISPIILMLFSLCLVILALLNALLNRRKEIKNKVEKPAQSKLKNAVSYINRTITPRGASRYIAFLALKPSTGNFFRKFAHEQTLVVYAHKDVDVLRPGTQVYDFEGIFDLIKFFNRKLGTELIGLKAISVSPQEKRDNNLICVGGPIPNKITETMLEQDEIRYKFQDHMIIDRLNNKPMCGFPSNWSGSNPPEDFGIITRIKNPFNPKKDSLILCGCFGWGTKMCTDMLLDDDNLVILNKEDYFQILCVCDIDTSGVAHRKRLVIETLHPISYKRAENL
jgi:hypothetical protein